MELVTPVPDTQISGFGTLTGAVTNSSSATIAVTGGNMTANSGITNSAAITIASGDTLSSTTTITNNCGWNDHPLRRNPQLDRRQRHRQQFTHLAAPSAAPAR